MRTMKPRRLIEAKRRGGNMASLGCPYRPPLSRAVNNGEVQLPRGHFRLMLSDCHPEAGAGSPRKMEPRRGQPTGWNRHADKPVLPLSRNVQDMRKDPLEGFRPQVGSAQ
jgi:hypothetical protein